MARKGPSTKARAINSRVSLPLALPASGAKQQPTGECSPQSAAQRALRGGVSSASPSRRCPREQLGCQLLERRIPPFRDTPSHGSGARAATLRAIGSVTAVGGHLASAARARCCAGGDSARGTFGSPQDWQEGRPHCRPPTVRHRRGQKWGNQGERASSTVPSSGERGSRLALGPFPGGSTRSTGRTAPSSPARARADA